MTQIRATGNGLLGPAGVGSSQRVDEAETARTDSRMRAIVVTRPGGPEVLELQEVPDAQPGPGKLLIAVEAAGVNYRDVYEREGRYRPPPLIAGAEGAGTVLEVGAGVGGFTEGDRVAWSDGAGSYADRIAVDAARVVPVPEGVSNERAAAVLLQGMTAQYLASEAYRVEPGDTVLVHAAAGGVGLLLTQIVKLRGGRVIATTSTEEKGELARAAGADEVLRYDDFAEQVPVLTGTEGLAAVYDGVGRTTFDESLASLRPRGTMVLYGAASGPVPPVDPMRLENGGSLFLTRPSLRHYTAERDELLGRAAEVFRWITDGTLNTRIGGRYPLEEARRAHEDLEARRTTGKLLLLPH
jgi:NADPH2:quinone reductase